MVLGEGVGWGGLRGEDGVGRFHSEVGVGRVAVGRSCPWEVSACGMVAPISVSVPLSFFGWS